MSAGPDYFRLACDLARFTVPRYLVAAPANCVAISRTCPDCGRRQEPLLEFEVADTAPGNRAESGRCRACQENAR